MGIFVVYLPKFIQMANLIGVHECKIDAKGRVLFPSALKKQLMAVINDGFVIKRSVFSRCLELYPMGEWAKEMEKINSLNRFIKKNNDFIRLFMAGVRIVELDMNSRLLIPKDLILYGGIQKEIVFAASLNKVEIWDKESYEKEADSEQVDFAALAEDVMGNVNQEDKK